MSLFMVVLGNRASYVPEVWCAYANVGYPMWIGSGSIEKCFERIESICEDNGWNLHRVKKYLEGYKQRAEFITVTDKRGNEERVPERYPKCEEYYLRQWEEVYKYEFEDRINTIESKLSTEKPRLKFSRPKIKARKKVEMVTADSFDDDTMDSGGKEEVKTMDSGKKKIRPRPKVRVRVKVK